MVKVDVENGHYLFKLDDLLKTNNISKNKIMRDTNTDFKTIDKIFRGLNTKFDAIVIARICDYLNCNLIDIIEYVPNKKS